MSFDNPEFLGLILLLLPLWGRYLWKKGKPAIQFPYGHEMRRSSYRRSRSVLLRHMPVLFRSMSLFCLVVALARPQLGHQETKIKTEGLDIVLAIDTSKSMSALDFKLPSGPVNRLEAVRHVVSQFIEARGEDRIGLVAFGDEAFTMVPLTLDHEILLNSMQNLRIGVAGGSTAIGDAIATASNRVKDVDAKSKIIILLTDGENTSGTIEPLIATKAAAALGIKVYTIGVGKEGRVPMPGMGLFGGISYVESNIDEETLQQISRQTGAKYFRAYDTGSLTKIYDTIDKLEKSQLEVLEHFNYNDIFGYFVWAGLLFVLLEVMFGMTRLRSVP